MVETKQEIVKKYGFKYREINAIIETKTHYAITVKNNLFIIDKKDKKIINVF